MPDTAIKVENLSKRYRVGLKEKTHDTLVGMLSSAVRSPVQNLRNLRRLSKVDDADADDTLWVLRDISFEVRRGEVVGIIGKNGAGKSTLLKILSRITEPSSGRAEMYGRVSSLLEIGTGFHPELTGRENVYLNGTILGMRKVEIDRKFDEIIDFAGIERFIDTPVKRYSSGMYVRLAFSVAAHLEPEILLVDEVLAVGDADFQKKSLGKMGDVAKEGRTVLFVSHNMGAVRNLCSHGILLRDGRSAFFGDIADCIDEYLNAQDKQTLPQIEMAAQPDGGPIQLTSIKVMNETGAVMRTFSFDETVKVKIGVRVYSPVSRIYLELHVQDSEQQALLFSRSFESNLDQLSNVWKPGDYSYSVMIPKLLLSPAIYRLSVHIASSMPVYVISGVDGVCPFEIIDSSSVRMQAGFPWIGKVSFFPHWVLEENEWEE